MKQVLKNVEKLIFEIM